MKKLLLAFTILILFNPLYSQDFNIVDFKVLSNDMDARIINPIMDFEGNKCALIKIPINNQNLVYSSEPNPIVKIQHKPGETWVYISQKAKTLEIASDNYEKIKYVFPVNIEPAMVYELQLYIKEEKIETQKFEEEEKPKAFVLIKSNPSEGNIFISNKFRGKTPLLMDTVPGIILDLSIIKSNFQEFNITDTIELGMNYITCDFKINQHAKRGFIFPILGLTFDNLVSDFPKPPAIAGFKLGSLGKTGWYLNTKLGHGQINPGAQYENEGKNDFNRIRLGSGITLQIKETRCYLLIGAGYSHRKFIDNVNLYDYSYNGFYGELGFVYRTREGFLWSMDFAKNNAIQNKNIYHTTYDFTIGFGYSFLLKK